MPGYDEMHPIADQWGRIHNFDFCAEEEPATTWPYMVWIDPIAVALKVRNAQDTAWIDVAGLVDEKVKISADDTTAGYLIDKITAGAAITLTEVNGGDDEDLQIAVNPGVIDHGALTGLADDDHSQYLLADGTRALSGPWDVGAHLVTFGAGITFDGASAANIVTVPDNVADALHVVDAGGLEYMRIVSTDPDPETGDPHVLFFPAGGGYGVAIGTTTFGANDIFRIAISAATFMNFEVTHADAGQLRTAGFADGWGIEARPDGQHLYFNRYASANSDLYLGRDGFQVFIQGSDGAITVAGPSMTVPDGWTLGQAAGPLLTFDDTNNRLEVTGCDVGFGMTPSGRLDILVDSGTGITADKHLRLTDGETNAQDLYLGVNTAGNYAYIQSNQQNVGRQPLVLNPGGDNVGIGMAPGQKLDVNGSIRIATGQSLIFNTASNSGVQFGFGTNVYRMAADGRLELSSQSGIVALNAAALQLIEMGAPGAGAANTCRIYAVDNGGKTELLAVFASGAAQQLAIEP